MLLHCVEHYKKIITLKLEEGEYGAVAIHDLCIGIFHSMTPSNNALTTVDKLHINAKTKILTITIFFIRISPFSFESYFYLNLIFDKNTYKII